MSSFSLACTEISRELDEPRVSSKVFAKDHRQDGPSERWLSSATAGTPA